MLLYALHLGAVALGTVGCAAWRSGASRKRKAAEMSDGGDSPPPTHDSESAPAGSPHQDVHAPPKGASPSAVQDGMLKPAEPAPAAGPGGEASPPPSLAPTASAGGGVPSDSAPASPGHMDTDATEPAFPAPSNSMDLSAGATAASGGVCSDAPSAAEQPAERVGGTSLPRTGAGAATPATLHATLPPALALPGAPQSAMPPAPVASGSGSRGRASGSQPGSSRGQPLSARAQRELKALDPFGWDRQKHKHPVNGESEMGRVQDAVRRCLDPDMADAAGAATAEAAADLAPHHASKRLKVEPKQEPASPAHSQPALSSDPGYDSDILSVEVIS